MIGIVAEQLKDRFCAEHDARLIGASDGSIFADIQLIALCPQSHLRGIQHQIDVPLLR
ncbi:hypothetical protein D3C78_1781060 [compost metagenome]